MDEKELQKLEEKKQKEMTARHTMSHVLVGAIKSIFGDVKFGIGPAIEDGFYYDFDMEHALNEEDFDAIDKKMRELVEQNLDMVREEVSREKALMMFSDQPYKVELIKDLPEDEVISVYHLGDVFTDLCRGPLRAKGYRVEKDFRNEKIGYKIREAVKMKIPYMVIIGDNEMNNNTVSIRKRGNESINDITFDDLCLSIDKDIENKI